MTNKYLLVAMLAALALPAYAAGVADPGAPASQSAMKKNEPLPDYEQMFRESAQDAELTAAEKVAIENYQQWATSGARSMQKSYVGADGSTVFTYGAQMPSVICALLQITDIALERGETINSVNIGDPSRWSVEPAVEGSGETMIQHVLIKPLDVGLDTSMLITTDRRTYRLKLKSVKGKYLPLVSFVYPSKALQQFRALSAQNAAERRRNTIETGTGEGGSANPQYLGDLNFNYAIEGEVSWKPVRVFDDGQKTIIEMPKAMLARNAPSLMVLDKEGGWFSDEKTSIINYRLQGTRYVVDGLFDQAILTLDVGDDQQRVVIKRGEQ